LFNNLTLLSSPEATVIGVPCCGVCFNDCVSRLEGTVERINDPGSMTAIPVAVPDGAEWLVERNPLLYLMGEERKKKIFFKEAKQFAVQRLNKILT